MPKGKHSSHIKGPSHHRWNSGKIVSREGYIKVRAGKDHPFADPNGYAYEHLLVWLSAKRFGRRVLTSGREWREFPK